MESLVIRYVDFNNNLKYQGSKKRGSAQLQCAMISIYNVHRGSNLFDKRFFPVKYWIVIAYAVSCCLLPKQTPYDL